MNIRTQSIHTVVTGVPLLLFFTLLNPNRLPVFLLVVPFALLFLFLYNVSLLLASFGLRLRGKTGEVASGIKRFSKMLSGFVVILAILGSVGQLTLRDVTTLVLIMAIGYFYMARSAKQRQSL